MLTAIFALLILVSANSYAISYVKYVVNFYKNGAVELSCGDTTPIPSEYDELNKKNPNIAKLLPLDVSNTNGWSAALNLGVSCRTPGNGYLAITNAKTGQVLGYIYDTGKTTTANANAGDPYAGQGYKFVALSVNKTINNSDYEHIKGTGAWYSLAILPNGEVKLLQDTSGISEASLIHQAVSQALPLLPTNY